MNTCPVNNLNLNDIWGDLESGIINVFENKRISTEDYLKFHHLIYTFCMRYFGDNPNPTIKPNEWQLYEQFGQFLNNYVINLNKYMVCKSEEGLKSYATQWKNYRDSSKLWNTVCKYMNDCIQIDYEQHGIKQNMYLLALSAWRNHCFKNLSTEIRTEVFKLIERERNGELIDEGLLSEIIQCFVEMGMKNEEEENLNIYSKDFERFFLAETQRYYLQKDTILFTSVTEYMKMVAEKIQEEENRVDRYLHISTKYSLSGILTQVLTEKRLDFIQNAFFSLLENDKNQDLSTMYNLLERVPNGLENLSPIFEKYVLSQGLLALEQCGKNALIDPKMYAENILKVYEKYHNVISSSFDKNKIFLAALDKACNSFINSNAVTKIAGSSAKSAELFSKYINILLKNCLELVPPFDDTLNQATCIIKYINDKDSFQLNYSTILVLRLVQQKFTNVEVEMFVIKKLAELFGITYTAKLEKIISDSNESKKTTEEFRAKLTDPSDQLAIGFSAQIFSPNTWPLQRSVDAVISLPLELQASITSFNAFFEKEFTGRKLSWLHAMSTGELHTNCFKKSYVLQVGILEMVVLLQYNNGTSWKMTQLAQRTLLKWEVLVQVVTGLVKAELLTYQEENGLVSLVNDYKNDELCINLRSTSEMESEVDTEVSLAQSENSWKSLIEVTITRIMKRHNTMQHLKLLTEVEKEVSFQFRPTFPMITKCIYILLEKGYLKKIGYDEDCYIYVP